MRIPLGVISAQQGVPPWTLLLDMRFNNNFDDSAGRHTPVNYGATTSSAQSVEGGYSLYTNQDGRVFSDGYNTDHVEFDFSAKDFRISCDIMPTAIGNDYVWMKSGSNDFGLTLKLGLSGPDVVAYLRGVGNTDMTLVVVIPDATTTWNNLMVERIGSTWNLYLNEEIGDTAVWSEGSQPTSGVGLNSFLIGGGSNDNRYAGYLDNFKVYSR